MPFQLVQVKPLNSYDYFVYEYASQEKLIMVFSI